MSEQAYPVFTTKLDVELIDAMGDDVSIARAAWISTGPDEREKDPGRVEGLIRYLMTHRHGTPFEHTSITFRVHAPIMVFREWMRHRIQSFNEQSGRYTQFDPVFYVPGDDRPLVNVGTSARPKMDFGDGGEELLGEVQGVLQDAYAQSWYWYKHLLDMGIANEVARLVVPVGMFSSMYATTNLRGWLHFLGLRTSEENATYQGHPQWEIVQTAKMVEEHLRTLFPITMKVFDENGRVAP